MMVNPSEEFWKGRRVLVTGHSGFKGAWLTLWLNQLGAEVMGLSLDDRSQHELFYLGKIENICSSIASDLRRPGIWAKNLLEFKPEIVFHLAAQSLVRRSYEEPVYTFETNVLGTVNLLEALRELDSIKSIIVATTDKVYRDVDRRRPFKEQDHLGGHDPYSASKAACEIAVASYRQSYFENQNIALSTGRAGNVIGGGDWAADRLIPDAIRAWTAGTELVIRNPNYTRPWQHVLEPLLGYLILAERTTMKSSLCGSYNFGPLTTAQTSVKEIISIAAKRFRGATYSIVQQENPLHESEWLDLDANLAKEILSVESRLTIEEAVEWTIDWYIKLDQGVPARELCISQIGHYANHREFK